MDQRRPDAATGAERIGSETGFGWVDPVWQDGAICHELACAHRFSELGS